MPSLYQDRWNRIYGNDSPPLAPSSTSNEPSLVQAARLRGMARGLVAQREQETEQRKYSDMMAQRAAEIARRERDDQLAADREERIARQLRENQQRLEEGDADRLTHQRFLERMAVTQNEREAAKAARAEEDATRIENERKQFEPVYRTAMGETGHGVTVDKDFNATVMADGKEVKLSGPLVLAKIKKLYGEDVRPPSDKIDQSEVRGRTRYTIGEIARGAGMKLNESQINALSDALESHPEQLATLPGLLKDDATYQKNAKQHEELVKALSDATVPEVEKLNKLSPLVAASPLGFLIQRLRKQRTPRVLALVNDAETPSVQEMDVNEAKENGYGIITQKDGRYLLNGQPIAAPAAPAPLLQRMFQGGQGAPQAVPVAPSDVVTRTLRDGTTVRVRKAADGTWQEVE